MCKLSQWALALLLPILPVIAFCEPKSEPAKDLIRKYVREILKEEQEGVGNERLVTLYDDGFLFIGRDDQLKIGGWYQGDLRMPEANHPQSTRFLNRRARLDFRGVLEYTFGYRLFGEFAGASAVLQEAWLSYDRYPRFRIRIGQYKEPFSLESMTSSLWIDFIETSLIVSNFQPAEDLGAMVFGVLLDKHLDYALGIFNGRTKNVNDNNDDKDVAGRVVVQPFRNCESKWVKNLFLGGSATFGLQETSFAGSTFTTAVGTPFLTFGSLSTLDGNRTRVGAEMEWVVGPSSFKTEWIGSRFQSFKRRGGSIDFWSHGWYATLTTILTGEEKVRNKTVVPKKDFNPVKGSFGIGAWELAVRFEQFFVEGRLIDGGFAAGTDHVDAVTLGLNCWPNKHTRIMGNYVYSRFDTSVATSGTTLDDEHAGLARVQFSF